MITKERPKLQGVIIMKNEKPVKTDGLLKWEVAEELGLTDKVLSQGWKSLSAKESGRIGGIVSNRKKQIKQKSITNEKTD
jgi:small acid-soluble spore protein F (minor alpha/beta-type SASP)